MLAPPTGMALPPSARYVLGRAFTDVHHDSVNVLATSPGSDSQQKYVASGAQDGSVAVFKLLRRRFHSSDARLWQRYDTPLEVSSAVCGVAAIAWGLDAEALILFVGFHNGQIFIYEGPTRAKAGQRARQPPDRYEIVDLRSRIRRLIYDQEERQVIVAHGEDISILRRNTRKDWRRSDPLPRIQITHQWAAIGEKLFISDIHLVPRTDNLVVTDQNYGIHCMALSDGTAIEKWRILLGKRIGHSDLSPDGTRIAAWNLAGSLHIYDLQTQTITATIPVMQAADFMHNKDLEVRWIHGGKAVVIGSNWGTPAIVDVGQQAIVQTLDHASDQRNMHVRAVAYAAYERCRFIVTADRLQGTDTKVKVWVMEDVVLMPSVQRFGRYVVGMSNIAVIGWVTLLVTLICLLLALWQRNWETHLWTSFREATSSRLGSVANGRSMIFRVIRAPLLIVRWIAPPPPPPEPPQWIFPLNIMKNTSDLVYSFFFKGRWSKS